MGNVHKLKTWPAQFHEVWWDRKPFELRKNDRDFQVGDILCLQEYDPETCTYSGKEVLRSVTYVLNAPFEGLQDGYCILGIRRI